MAKNPTQRLDELEPFLVDIKGIIDALRLEMARSTVEQEETASTVTGLKAGLDALLLKVTHLEAWKDSIGSFADPLACGRFDTPYFAISVCGLCAACARLAKRLTARLVPGRIDPRSLLTLVPA